jgi:hypothetical protein
MLAWAGLPATAQQQPQPTSATETSAALPAVEVLGHYANGLGTSDAASQGSVSAALMAARPTLRPAEVLEFVPGVIVTQHSGDGKANQYFLRGFNLDHGTDFASFVDGMPANMPTHAHGQGYTDLNWLIPELIARLDYAKGPYRAQDGDFSSAGSARIRLFDTLPAGIASATLGANGYARTLVASSLPWADGQLLYALEASHNNGPWDSPERFHRFNGLLRYSLVNDDRHSSLTAMAYNAGWFATDQIPLRALQQGLIGRFGAIDPSDGGQTSRYSLSFNTRHMLPDGSFELNAYAIRSRLDLFSDFTFNLEHPLPANADQFEQAEARDVLGLATSRSWQTPLAGHDSSTTLGLQLRQDRLDPVGLYGSLARQRTGTVQESRVRETSLGLYAENATQWQPWLRSIVGLRHDQVALDVASSIAANSGRASAGITSPKLSLVLGPWRQTEYFVNLGWGFHSNDARGVTETVTPKEGLPAEPAPALVRTKGAELGLRSEPLPGWQTSVSLWTLSLASELVFSGDAGDTQASGASRRHGLEVDSHSRALPWLLLDGSLALSRARFAADQGDAPHAGRYVPGAADTVVSLGATVVDAGPWFGHLQLRYFGPRPLIEDNSQRSSATTLAYLRLGYTFSPRSKLSLDVFNLFNRQASDIDYAYASRLPVEPPGGVNDIHFHPVEPRSLRLTLQTSF